MRVGVFIPGAVPQSGGAHTYESSILGALNDARTLGRHEVAAIGLGAMPHDIWSGEYISLYAPFSTRASKRAVRTLRGIVRRGSTKSPTRFESTIDRYGLDLIWCVTAGTPSRQLPYVTTVWDLQHRLQPTFPEVSAAGEWLRRERFYAQELGEATRVIVGTDAGQAEVERFYGVPANRIRKLPHPTPSFAVEKLDDMASQSAFDLRPGYVLYPAQFWAHKNHVTILRALRRIRDEHDIIIDAAFVGSDHGNEGHVRAVAESLGLTGQVHFLGFVSRPQLLALYRSALAMTYVSFFGPENLPPLEAFALGCPVIASNVAGSEEQLGDAAILVPTTDDAALAAALIRLRSDPKARRRLIERGRERALVNTPARYVVGMAAVVEELAPIVATWRR